MKAKSDENEQKGGMLISSEANLQELANKLADMLY